jgi:hypothetical protein
LWDDPVEYARFSASALEFSRRPDMQPGHQINKLLQVLEEV